jgi:hypothetical protein
VTGSFTRVNIGLTASTKALPARVDIRTVFPGGLSADLVRRVDQRATSSLPNPPVLFTWTCHHQDVVKTRRRYGAIMWHPEAGIDDAIRLVKGADDQEEAVRFVAPVCPSDQRWAVIDLTTINVVASGPASCD